MSARQVIEHASRRAHHHMSAVRQTGALAPQRHTADQRDHLDVVGCPRQPPDFSGDLIGQFAGRTKDQSLHREAPGIEFGQQGQSEGRRFAAARLGLCDQVSPLQGGGQAGRLDGGHFKIAQAAKVLVGGGRQGEFVEALGCRRGEGHARILRTHARLVRPSAADGLPGAEWRIITRRPKHPKQGCFGQGHQIPITPPSLRVITMVADRGRPARP